MDREQISNWGIKIGALTLACGLWFYVVSQQVYEMETDILLVVEDPSASLGVVAKVIANKLPPTVRVVVAGPGKDLLHLDSSIFTMHLQAEGAVRDTVLRNLSVADVKRLPTDLDIEIRRIVRPLHLETILDHRAERSVAVVPQISIEVVEGFTQVGPISLSPATVQVSGPRTYVEGLQSITTDSVWIAQVDEDVELLIDLDTPGGVRASVRPPKVLLSADVQILAEDKISGVPVQVRYAGSRRVTTNPPRVEAKVRGGVDVITRLDVASDLGLFVDFREYSGTALPVRAEANSRFEIREIVPGHVGLVER